MIQKLVERFAELGTRPQEDPKQNQNIRFVNIICLFVILVIISHMLLTFYFQSYLATLVQLIVIHAFGLAIFLNSRYFFNLARALTLLIGNFHVFNMVLILGIESGVHFYFSVAIITPLFFYSNKELKYILFFVALSTALILVSQFIGNAFESISQVSETLQTYFFYFSVIGSQVTVFVLVFYFFNESYRLDKLRKKAIGELKIALSEVKKLSGLLPICSSCKKIRDDKGYWNQIESYIRDHSDAEFSHSICQECAKELYPDIYPEFYEE